MKDYSDQTCLNGWWDYRPDETNEASTGVPQTGWDEGKYLVPSLVNKSLGGVRKQGASYYEEHLGADPVPFCDGEHEFLFDNHDYPLSWTAASSGWARRTLELAALPPGRRRILRLDAVSARSEIWINGQQVATHADAFLPQEIDVTDYLIEGANELAVRICDYERLAEKTNKTLTPSGNMMTSSMRGIWQDVWLIERGEVSLNDCTLRTSFREQTLEVQLEVINASAQAQTIDLSLDVAEWASGIPAFDQAAVLDLPSQSLSLAAGAVETVTIKVPWADAKPWQPESPALYWLRGSIRKSDTVIDQLAERFGFREVWIEGPDFILNGFPVHFFSDWGHKLNQLNHTVAWNRCWFAMMQEGNFNHSRLHTHPHPEFIMDMADEAGIMITGETSIHGSGGDQAADSEAYWEAARAHIAAYVRRDKNHPSLLLWSVENEMRWNQDATDLTKRVLPELYTLFRQLDPTREAYHEGDSSLWDESRQAIMSRHYGKECGGYGWWDKARPLHAGEMSSYHYMGPNTNFHTGGGDALWADYQQVVEAAARETKWIVESGRTQGTAAFGPWNLSCLCNLRMENSKVELSYDDWTTPGVKPLYINPHTAEFEFWKDEGAKYTPFGQTNAIQGSAFRPFALLDLSHRRSYFGDTEVKRTLYCVNDTAADQSGTCHVVVTQAEAVLFETTMTLSVDRGRRLEQTLELNLPPVEATCSVRFSVTFTGESGEVLDAIDQEWTLSPKVPTCEADRGARITVVGEGVSQRWLEAMGFDCETLDALDAPIEGAPDLLIMEPNTVVPGSLQNQWVEDYLQAGGRVLLLEQKYSLFPEVVLESKPQLHGYIRGYEHPVLEGFTQEDFQFWGEDPFASLRSDAQIAQRVYQKGEACALQPVVDAGEGGIGLKLPEWIALGEVRSGQGTLLASQFRFAEKAKDIPEAGRLFAAMLEYLLAEASTQTVAAFAEAEASDSAALEAALEKAQAGGKAWLRLRDAAGAKLAAEKLGVSLSAVSARSYQAVRKVDAVECSGISHVDICGVDGMTYCFGIESQPVAECSLEPVAQLEPLLVTPTKALLEEFHIYGQRPEPLRTHAASRFLFAEAPAERVLLGRVPYGAGFVYLDTFAPLAEAHPRIARYESLLRRNLGYSGETTALTGAAVPEAIEFSQGYPRQICRQTVADASRREAMAANTALPAERMAPTNLLGLGGWTAHQDESGKWIRQSDGEEAFFTCFHSPRARKIVMEDSGIPNPESLTFLDVAAPSGQVELILNGASKGTQKIANGRTTFSDLELVQGFNQMLVLWEGGAEGESLHFRYRDIMQNPETELIFLVANKDLQGWSQSEF